MSNEIYGFADFPDRPDLPILLATLGSLTPLGVFSVPEDSLVGFPPDLRPGNQSFIFVVGDSKKSMNAEYVLDNRDYAPCSLIGLPVNADERFSMLIAILLFLLTDAKCARLVVGLTVCNEIDRVKHLPLSDMAQTLKDDCSKESPPCIIYVVTP